MRTFYKIKEQDCFYTVIANITNKCNFCCEYCCEHCNTTYDAIDLNLKYLKSFIINILPLIKNKQKILKLSLYGGEPTLHKDIIRFCVDIKNKYHSDIYIEVYSNFSSDFKLYNHLLSLDINLILTAHNNKIFSADDFYNNILKLDNTKIANNVIFNVMFEKDAIQHSINLYDKICKFCKHNNIVMKLPPLLKKVRSTSTCIYKYSENELNIFNTILSNNNNCFLKQYVLDNNGIKIYYSDNDLEKCNMCFRHWLCYSGYSSCYIDVDGSIYRCQSDLYNNVKSTFNIYRHYDFNKITIPHICNAKLCTDYDSKKITVFKC